MWLCFGCTSCVWCTRAYIILSIFNSLSLCFRFKSIKIIIPFPLCCPLITSALFRKRLCQCVVCIDLISWTKYARTLHIHSHQFAHLHLTNEIDWTKSNERKRYTNTCAYKHVHEMQKKQSQSSIVGAFVRLLAQFMCARSFNMLILLAQYLQKYDVHYYLLRFSCHLLIGVLLGNRYYVMPFRHTPAQLRPCKGIMKSINDWFEWL